MMDEKFVLWWKKSFMMNITKHVLNDNNNSDLKVDFTIGINTFPDSPQPNINNLYLFLWRFLSRLMSSLICLLILTLSACFNLFLFSSISSFWLTHRKSACLHMAVPITILRKIVLSRLSCTFNVTKMIRDLYFDVILF